jgi:hypothetical protein
VATITAPANGALFQAGETITFSGFADDPDEVLGGAAFSWSVVLNRAGEIVPFAGPFNGTNGSFAVPVSGIDFGGDTSLEVHLTVTDSTQNSDTTSVTIVPEKVSLSFETLPSGLVLGLDGVTQTTPFVVDALIGFEHTITALATHCDVGTSTEYGFAGWSDGGAATHPIVVPATDQTFTATYTALGACSSALIDEDFDDVPVGTDPADWFDTGANSSLAENDLFRVFDVGGEQAIGTTSTATNIYSHFVGAGTTGSSAYEYSGRMLITNSKGGIGVTFFSDFPNTDTYYRLRRGNFLGGSFQVAFPHGTNITSGVTDTGVVPSANVWYRFRIEVEDTGTRTEIRARVWEDGTTEPAGWQVDCFDDSPTRLTSGTAGLWSMANGSKYWDDLAVR